MEKRKIEVNLNFECELEEDQDNYILKLPFFQDLEDVEVIT